MVDAFAMKASTCDLITLGERMKAARAALDLTQTEFHEKYGCGSVRTYQKNEAGSNEAGICLAGSFVRAGINANWLLTGEGPMFLANLQASPEENPAAALRPAINAEVLGAVIEGTLRVVPDAPAHKLAAHIASVYVGFIEQGLLTVDGKQTGGSLDVAA